MVAYVSAILYEACIWPCIRASHNFVAPFLACSETHLKMFISVFIYSCTYAPHPSTRPKSLLSMASTTRLLPISLDLALSGP